MSSKHPSKKREAWRLLSLARDILPHGNPIKKCRYTPRGKVKIKRYGNKHSFDGLVTCQSGWSCPICSPKKALKRARQIRELHSNLDYDSIMVTYTIRHSVRDNLSSLLDALYGSLRAARNGRRHKEFYKLVHGYIRSTEIMYGSNGWHPHIHEVIYIKKGATIDQIKDTVVRHYKEALDSIGKKSNKHTVDVKRWDGSTDYVTKGSDIEEVVGWVNKEGRTSLNIFQILRRSVDSDRFKNLFTEYYYATKRRKITIVSRSLADAYKQAREKIDNEDEQQEGEVIHEFDRDEWRQVAKANMQYQILITLDNALDNID